MLKLFWDGGTIFNIRIDKPSPNGANLDKVEEKLASFFCKQCLRDRRSLADFWIRLKLYCAEDLTLPSQSQKTAFMAFSG